MGCSLVTFSRITGNPVHVQKPQPAVSSFTSKNHNFTITHMVEALRSDDNAPAKSVVRSRNSLSSRVFSMDSRTNELFGKQVGILHELLPQAVHFGVLVSSRSVIHETIVTETQAAASAIGGTIEVLDVSTSSKIDEVFARIGNEKKVQGLLVTNDPLFVTLRVQLALLAARYAVPVISPFRQIVEAGGLLSYGPNLAERDRQAALYVGRILNGENPADLPVQQMSKFELVINMKTAKVLGLEVPPSVLALADEVID